MIISRQIEDDPARFTELTLEFDFFLIDRQVASKPARTKMDENAINYCFKYADT